MHDEIDNAVAIVGMSGKFPGAKTPEELWKNVCKGLESIDSFSMEDLKDNHEDPLQTRQYVKARGILDNISDFDVDFFGLNFKEAQAMDPQHRLFLESSWEALENAGYCADKFQGLIGVYGGTSLSTYYLHHLLNNPNTPPLGEYLLQICNDKDYLTTRISYKLNLKGPSITIQTACSTSLVAVCVAINHLLTYQCDIAIAGGVSITVPQKRGYLFQEGMIFSPDGKCRPFDAAAQGTVPGNGVGAVVLRRLEDALESGDHIYAIIRGYGMNNDGSEKVGFSAPSIPGQVSAISAALTMADINPETVSLIEAHGTATPMGDPIEVKALTEAFASFTSKKQFCAIGSIKSNIGHLMEASGVTGLIKTALALHHSLLPPTINYRTPNTNIDFASSPFYVNTELRAWDQEGPKRASVSSFGIGGTNAHIVLEEAPEPFPATASKPHQLILLSAKTPTALERLKENLLQHAHSSDIADICYTLQVGRKDFDYRGAILCSSQGPIKNEWDFRGRVDQLKKPSVIFIFPDIVSGYPQIALGLYQNESVYRKAVDECAQFCNKFDLREALYSLSFYNDHQKIAIMFATEYALAKLLHEWGVTPSSMIGFGVGECVISALTGTLSLEKAFEKAEHVGGKTSAAVSSLSTEAIYLVLGSQPMPNFSIPLLPNESDPKDDYETLLSALGQLWTKGVTIDWEGFYQDERRYRVPLPTYPFEKQRVWIEPTPKPKINTSTQLLHSSMPEEIEQTLLKIWKDLLGIKSIGRSDNFFLSGGDSILSISLSTQIEKVFGRTIKPQQLIDAPTIAEQTLLLLNSKIQEQCIVTLRPGVDDLPVFFIHPIDGNVLCYKALSEKLVIKGPIYGIQACSNHALKSVEELAKYYLALILKVQTDGPYRIVGASFGGLIAFEVSKLLESSNRKVALLGMIDIPRPGLLTPRSSNEEVNMVETMLELLSNKQAFGVEQLSLQEKTALLAEGLRLGGLSLSQQREMYQLVKKHWTAAQAYNPKPYRGQILFYEARDKCSRMKDISFGSSWKDLCHKIEIHMIPGDHYSILTQPHVSQLADLLSEALTSSLA